MQLFVWDFPHIMAYWAIAGVILDGVANALPTTGTGGRVRAVIAVVTHVSPGAVISAVKQVGAAFNVPTGTP